ncbi:acyltransferase [Yersinia ruckeri]|uniref:acyltransferase family protein n=1 Tax=Yersinia ruckeri TaxID=29486 RepID=UPI0011A2173C|nr:acyltransferase family protein [Yersinia ruckeri]EKN3345412.1 acyltransferase [Yersinia ruckeri]EKN4704174.1 acyltransferase [Yersinia ruckeri]ELM3746457.1 acyltransferase [Yersinia ruckeri]MCK8561128.1 acyltransferase [Yersinia ruckeri]MCW6547777.1 acyltransferase [Yersinia ruckeri]
MRNVGLHALKSLSCFSAVTFYSASKTCTDTCFLSGEVMGVLYFLSIIATPLFFMIIGYIDSIKEITKNDIFKKIKSILTIIIFWNVLFYFLDEEGFKKGYFLQSWLLFSIALIYIINPIIAIILKSRKSTLITLGTLLLFSVSIDIISTLTEKPYLIDFPQYFRLWTWIFYYMVGRFLCSNRCKEMTKNIKVRITAKLLIVPTAISMYFYESFMSLHVYKTINAGYFLDNFHLLIISLCLFVIFDNFDTKYEWIKKTLAYISPSMIGVYILHDGIFYFISNAYNPSDIKLRFTLLLSVFVASVLLSRILLSNKFTSRFISF